MGKHEALKPRLRVAVTVAAAAALLVPLAVANPARADEPVDPAVVSIDPIDWWWENIVDLGYAGVPDAAPGNNLEVPWYAYDHSGDLYAVRPWDNEWITYTEYAYEGSDGQWWWKVVAVTNDGGPILSPVGNGLNVKDGWVTTTFAPNRAEFILPQRKG